MVFLFLYLGMISFAEGNTENSGASSTPPPAQVVTNGNASINSSPMEGEPSSRFSESTGDLFFSQRLAWDEAKYAVRYTIVLEQKRENLDQYLEILRRNTEYTYIDITVPPGEYRFLVMSYNILGLLDTQSEWNYFFIRNPITLLQPRSGISLSNDPISTPSVMWSTELPLQNSRVIFSRDPEPTKDPRAIVQYVDPGTTIVNLPPLSEGIWYWTVLGETSDGLSVSAAAPLWFTLLSMPLLSSPQYIRPGYDEVITLDQLMTARKVTFEWEQVPDANAYIFSLYSITDKRDLLFSTSPGPETSYELTDLTLLLMEDYLWQVEAVFVSRNGTIERRGRIQQQSFMVYVQRSDTLRIRNPGTRYGF